jgi:tetratricopeptide (TPR) repeat protein
LSTFSLHAAVPIAYWLIDQQQAKKLFVDAFDVAMAQKTDPPVAPVLSRIAKRDRALATELMKRLLAAKSEETDPGDNAFSTARELFKTDPRFAIELAKLSASFGPSMDGMSILFEVARTDAAGAAEIYDAYMKSLRAGNLELSSVLWLAGYPLGYGEAYGGSNDPAGLSGFMGMRIPGLKPQPDLAAAYLQIAFVAITNTLKKGAVAGNPDTDVLNALALFSTSYLFLEVQRYLPDAEAAWSGLYRQALAGTSERRRAEVEQRVRSIRDVRARTSEQSGEDFARGDAKEKLAEIEKLPDMCHRDRAYAQAALAHSYAKEFTQARQVADRIDNLKQRDAVVQFTYYDEVAAMIESGDLVRALDWAEKVAAKDERAVLYVRIANAALKKSDKSMVLDALNRARSLVADSEDADLKAGVLLSVGALYARFDASEATYITRESIKSINRMKERIDETFSVVRRVSLSCVGEITWHGSSEKVEGFSFYETLGAIAKTDAQAEGALALAAEVQDKATRIRAQLAIVKAVIN